MRFALYSDLHLELLREPWQPPALDVDAVILAGDIGKHTHGIEWAADAFRQAPVSPDVLYVAGNHEYYGAQLGLLDELRNSRWARMGVRFLERNAVEEPGVRILGCTLWSAFDLYGADNVEVAMEDAECEIKDYLAIRTRRGKLLSAHDTLRLHRKAVAWLDTELAKPFDGRTVVVTHFAPHRGCIAPQHQGTERAPYFVTDLAWLMEKYRIDVWCHGHTHTNNDFITDNGCRVVSNQRGYANEIATSGFRPDLVIEV
jgi:predicted phosphodiesterase